MCIAKSLDCYPMKQPDRTVVHNSGPPRNTASPERLQQLYATLPLPNSRCIRVIEISYIGEKANLCGTLRVVDLRTCPAFVALSYVWGQHSTGDTICCNGVDVPITRNCHDALLATTHTHSSSRGLTGATITIWVDAICINQADDAEKAVQIPLMQEVYTWARVVYVWLGSGSPSSERAIHSLTAAPKFRLNLWGIPWFLRVLKDTIRAWTSPYNRSKSNNRLCSGEVGVPDNRANVIL